MQESIIAINNIFPKLSPHLPRYSQGHIYHWQIYWGQI